MAKSFSYPGILRHAVACLFLFYKISLTIEINREIISILDISIVEVLDERKSARVRSQSRSRDDGD